MAVIAVDVSAVHVDFAGQRRIVALLHQRFPDHVRQHEGGLVLDAQVAAKLQG